MVTPIILTWVEQRYQFIGHRVRSIYLIRLGLIAPRARPSEVTNVISSRVTILKSYLWDDVLLLKYRGRKEFLFGNPTILTAGLGTLLHIITLREKLEGRHNLECPAFSG